MYLFNFRFFWCPIFLGLMSCSTESIEDGTKAKVALEQGEQSAPFDTNDLSGSDLKLISGAPTISVTVHPPTPTNIPTFSLDSDEDGVLSLSGDCSSGTAQISGLSSISDTSGGSPETVTITGLSEGSYYACSIVVTDSDSMSSTELLTEFLVDSTSDAPVITGITNDTGVSSTDLITTDAAVEFTGTSEASAEVTLVIADSSTSVTCITTANISGAWVCDASTSVLDTYAADLGTTLSSVSYSITATAVDSLSNAASGVSNTLSVIVDQEVPTLTVTSMGTVSNSNPIATLTSSESGSSTFTFGTQVTDDCANLTFIESADTTSGNGFAIRHETTGGFADNTGSTYACTATVTDPAGNVSSEDTFTFEVTLVGPSISQSVPPDSTAGAGSTTSNSNPSVTIYSNTAIDTTTGDLITWSGGCGSAAATLAVDDNTDVIKTRLENYIQETHPVSQFFSDNFSLNFVTIDASYEVSNIQKRDLFTQMLI